ncbi:MAG: hypothetical protein JSR60_08045 [Proteobacteria bacterium]|nr:hypothetical protein [Pseudomonadota bacterium]
MALKPDEMDFIQNFSTLWAVFLGALLATIGGFTATQLEWHLERRRRERNAALFFGEVLATMNILLNFAADTKKIGDPYGPITQRMFRSAVNEIDIYNRNRETLYDLRSADLRARIHTLTLRIAMSIDGIFDTTSTIVSLQDQLREGLIAEARQADAEQRIANLTTSREGSFDFVMESSAQLKAVIRDLEPIARFNFDDVEKAVRNA